MKSLKILFLIEGNNKIGMGHIYRTSNLALVLKKRGHKIIFLSRSKILKEIIPQKILLIFNTGSKIDLKKKIEEINPDISIVDKLEESSEILNILKKYSKLIGIDYTSKNKNIFQYGINILYPNSGIKEISLSGFEYAIINPKFVSKRFYVKKHPKSIIVLQGGSDTKCFTVKILNALNHLQDDYKITAILGPAFNCWKKLKKISNKYKRNLRLIHNPKDLLKEMMTHDLAITAGGMTLLELCRLGIPSIIICGEDFENETAKLIENKGFGKNLGYGEQVSQKIILSATRNLLENYNLRTKMSKKGKMIIDVKGAKRVTRIIEDIGEV